MRAPVFGELPSARRSPDLWRHLDAVHYSFVELPGSCVHHEVLSFRSLYRLTFTEDLLLPQFGKLPFLSLYRLRQLDDGPD